MLVFTIILIKPTMKKLLLALATLTLCLSAAARTLYLENDPVVDPYKSLPPGTIHSGPKGLNAVILVYSDVKDLQFGGRGLSDDDDNCLYDDEEACYLVQVFNDTHTVYIINGDQRIPLHADGGFGSSRIYTVRLSDSPTTHIPRLQQITVNTDEGAYIYVDGMMVSDYADSQNFFEVTPGKHHLVATKAFDAYTTSPSSEYTGEIYTYSSEEKEINTVYGRHSTIDLPITGCITFNLAEKHASNSEFVNVEFAVDKAAEEAGREAAKAAGRTFIPTIIPSNSTFSVYSPKILDSLYGNYIATYSEKGYHTKRSRYTIGRASNANGEIKLDKIASEFAFLYHGSLNSLVGMKLAGCGKYFGWYASGGFVGVNHSIEKDIVSRYYTDDKEDTNLSWNVVTGPVFRILRTKTSILLSLGGGYGQIYFDDKYPEDHLSSWVVNVDVDFRFKSGFTLGVGYNYFFKKYNGCYENNPLYNLNLNIGYTIDI